MRYNEFARTLVEKAPNTIGPMVQPLDKNTIKAALNKAGIDDEHIKEDGNKLFVLVEVPEGQAKNAYRIQVMDKILASLQQQLPTANAKHVQTSKLGSLGGIMFDNSPIGIGVKDTSVQGAGSSGKLNEENLRSMLQILIQEYGSVNVTFVDKRGKKIGIKNCNKVDDASMNVQGRQKADLILSSTTGKSLPISLKKIDADMWESADSLFGKRAKEILMKLQKEGSINMQKLKDADGEYYRLPKEIVVEPTAQEAMDAVFGADLLKKGAVVVQTFKDEHFRLEENNLIIQCEYIITSKEDIPESHLMVWLIRNNRARNNPLPGLRTLGVTLSRGIGKSGNKDVVLVDQHGDIVNT